MFFQMWDSPQLSIKEFVISLRPSNYILPEYSAKPEPLDVLQPHTPFVLGSCSFLPEPFSHKGQGEEAGSQLHCWPGVGPHLCASGPGFETLTLEVGSTGLRL